MDGKSDWPREYKHDFKMRVSLRPHESGGLNHIASRRWKIHRCSTAAISGLSVEPENLPGLLEWEDVEDLPYGYIKYCRVKAPCMKARDHVWKYTIDKRDDGSIFVTIRTCQHEKYPVKKIPSVPTTTTHACFK